MKPITQKTLRGADWQRVYAYDGATLSFVIFICDALPGMTIAKEKRRGKTYTVYTVFGKRTDSLIQATRLWNVKAHEHVKSGRQAAGSPQSLRPTRRETGV